MNPRKKVILWACGLVAATGLALVPWLLRQSTPTPPPPPQEPVQQPDPSPPQEPVTPPESVPQGVFGIYEKEARNLLAQMTQEEKLGQVFFVRAPTGGETEKVLAQNPGGLVLFGRDFKDKNTQQVQRTLADYQEASKYPLLIGVDEEGGTVCRISSNPALRPQRFLSPQALYAQGGLKAIEQDAKEKAELLLSLGVNVNLAPVADVTQNPKDFIYPRTVGLDAQGTGGYVETVINATQSQGLGTAMKHFPGYGSNADTHTGSAKDTRSLQQFQQQDLVPFRSGIEAGGQSILVSHNVIEAMEPGVPASLSPKVHQLLRQDLGFTGVIMTDDLIMGAITDYCGDRSPAVEALNAGNDLLLVSDLSASYTALAHGLEAGQISQERLDDAVLRVLQWKLALGLFDEK